MSLFTRGPWVAEKTGRGIGPVSKKDDQSYGMVIPVAWVEFDPEVEIQAANQQLIAAAPELLEALQELLFLYEHDEGCRQITEYKRAKAAVSKALGQ